MSSTTWSAHVATSRRPPPKNKPPKPIPPSPSSSPLPPPPSGGCCGSKRKARKPSLPSGPHVGRQGKRHNAQPAKATPFCPARAGGGNEGVVRKSAKGDFFQIKR